MDTKHKIISCAGFGGTGSSAITDLLSEFEGIKGIGTFEFTILHDVDGILDLKHSIVDRFERLNCTEAIYRFERLINNVEGMYRPYLGDSFRIESNNYIDTITITQWRGFWHQHLYRGSKFEKRVKYKIPEKIQRILYNIFIKNSKYEYTPYYLKKDIKLCYDKEKFMVETKKYINSLINILDSKNEYEYLALDQLVTPYNLEEYYEFFDDLKVIIVDRDPRDLYLLNKIYWKEGWIPSHDVELYVKWFKGIRKDKINYNGGNSINIMFEELIYNYENTVKKIIEFLGIDECNHINKLKKFNPEKSIKNCRLWENEKQYTDDIKYIEQNLKEYCFKLKR